MKMVIKAFMVTILAFILAVGGTACMDSPENMGAPSTSGVQTLEEGSSTEATMVENFTEPNKSAEHAEKQIVEAIYSDIYGYNECDGVDFASQARTRATKLSDRYLGRVNSEEDAIEKADAAWCEVADFEKAKDMKPYEVRFYIEHNVFLVNGTLPPQTTDSNGRVHATLGNAPFIIIQKSDGKVLATWWG